MPNYLYYDYMSSSICKVQEETNEYIPCTSIESYLNSLCLKKGSSLKGRRQSFSHQMHIKRYIPIVIDKDTIYFPIHPIRQYDCIWVHYANIRHVTFKKKTCVITFHDHTHLVCTSPARIRRNLAIIRQYLQMI